MKSTVEERVCDEQLQALYQHITRGIPNDADRRLTIDEMLVLAGGGGLGARQADAMRGVAESADQALLLRVLTATENLSSELARDLKALSQTGLLDRLQSWWRTNALPPVFASAGIALMAVIGFQFLGSSPLPITQSAHIPAVPATSLSESPMFGGAFEASDQMFAASLEPNEISDQVFGGDFDS
jgi:hypothetical protein